MPGNRGSNHTARTTPRLWVETLWILDSLETSKPLREIKLSRGLNLVLSAPTAESTGHGVGKTAFCQLLRFVLEDPQWASGTSLPDELRHTFPDGAAAARIHVEDEVWTVVKPWKHQHHYRAARHAGWQAVAHDEVSNERDVYIAALERSLVDILPARTFPGSDQPIEWKHILAWCSRDQGCRYLDYYHWRSKGIGFPYPAKSPATLVKMVLGLLDDPKALHKLKKLQDKLAHEESALERVRDQPRLLRSHVKHQLCEALDQPENSPFRPTGLFPTANLKALADQRLEGYANELEQAERTRKDLEQQRDQILVQRAPMAQSINVIENRIAQEEAVLARNFKELERLKKEPESLQAMAPQMCVPGNILFGKCEYVRQRIETVSFDAKRQAALQGGEADARGQRIAEYRESVSAWQQHMAPLDHQLAKLSNSLEELENRKLVTLSAMKRLEEATANYELYDDMAEGRTEWPELKTQESAIKDLKAAIDRLKLQTRITSGKQTSRHTTLESAFDALAKKLPDLSWGVFHEDDPRPFRLGESHSAALSVLEMLVGDFVCLADSASPESLHPGFLLHDSPREAELSEPVFWAFLSEVAGQGDTFQYIVTTSTHAPDPFRQYIRLELGNRNEDEMLFFQRLGAEQESLEEQ